MFIWKLSEPYPFWFWWRLHYLGRIDLNHCMLHYSVASDSLWRHGLQPARFLGPWDSPGKHTGVGCHALLQGNFPTQELNWGLLHCRQILYQLSYQGSPYWPWTGEFSFQSQRRAVPKNVQTTQQLHSFCILVRLCSKSFKLGFSSMWNETQMYQLGFKKGRGTRDQIANIRWIIEKWREFQKNICFIDYEKALTMWITTNCGKFLKRWEYQTTLLSPEKPVCRSISNS